MTSVGLCFQMEVLLTFTFVADLQVLDTCGLCDTERTQAEIRHEIQKSMIMVAPGPHAFILVLALEKFTDELKQAISILESLFPNFYDQTIIVFTKCEGKDIHTDIGSSEEIDSLCQKVSRRYVVFNNSETESSKRDKMVFDLLNTAYDLYRLRQSKFYTCITLQKAEAAAKERDAKIKLSLQKHHDSAGIVQALRIELQSMIRGELQTLATCLSPSIMARWLNLMNLNKAPTCSQSFFNTTALPPAIASSSSDKNKCDEIHN